MFIVVSYDIVNDKTRNKVAKVLLNFGMRVQYSVFECDLTDKQVERLEKKLLKLINGQEDSVRLYFLCDGCYQRVRVHGQGQLSREEEVYIV